MKRADPSDHDEHDDDDKKTLNDPLRKKQGGYKQFKVFQKWKHSRTLSFQQFQERAVMNCWTESEVPILSTAMALIQNMMGAAPSPDTLHYAL